MMPTMTTGPQGQWPWWAFFLYPPLKIAHLCHFFTQTFQIEIKMTYYNYQMTYYNYQ